MNCDLAVWTTEEEIFSIALMLNRTIAVYTDGKNEDWQIFHKLGRIPNVLSKKKKRIYLTNTNGNHFDIVTSV